MCVGFKFYLILSPTQKGGCDWSCFFLPPSPRAINKQKVNIQKEETYKCVRNPVMACRGRSQSRIINSKTTNLMPCVKE